MQLQMDNDGIMTLSGVTMAEFSTLLAALRVIKAGHKIEEPAHIAEVSAVTDSIEHALAGLHVDVALRLAARRARASDA